MREERGEGACVRHEPLQEQSMLGGKKGESCHCLEGPQRLPESGGTQALHEGTGSTQGWGAGPQSPQGGKGLGSLPTPVLR